MSPRALRWKDRRRRDDDGASAVEFALVVIPLLFLVMGILQASAWMWAKQAGAHASREGARRAAVAPACTGFDTYVKDFVGPAAESWSAPYGVDRVVTPAPTNTSGSTKVGDTVKVTVVFKPVELVTMFPFPDITEVVESRIENVPSSGGAC